MFEWMLMQLASTGNASMDSVVAIVVAAASIATVIGGLLKQNAKTNTVGQYIDTFGQKTLEQEENMKRALLAARSAVPELDEKLKAYKVPLSTIEERIEKAQEQIEFFRTKTGSKAQAASLKDLPREAGIIEKTNFVPVTNELKEKDVKIKHLSDKVEELENSVKRIMDKLKAENT
jgi:predicted  nucleic acid-binding Zn-ribbon protein